MQGRPPLPCAGAVLWAVVNELLIQPREYSAFNLSLERLRDDPRIMVTLGTPVSGYGQARGLAVVHVVLGAQPCTLSAVPHVHMHATAPVGLPSEHFTRWEFAPLSACSLPCALASSHALRSRGSHCTRFSGVCC